MSDPVTARSLDAVTRELRARSPALIHIQHEYGLFGRKAPLSYVFPRWVARLRREFPGVPICATAHSVVESGHRYSVRGAWPEQLARRLGNRLAPMLNRRWREGTWGLLDAVIVHSERQVAEVIASGCSRVVEIPHFVPEPGVNHAIPPWLERFEDRDPLLLVFGYFTPEKGQDLVLRALARRPGVARLVLAGGARRTEDRWYLARCERMIEDFSLNERVRITGFVADEDLAGLYARADLVIAPFTATSGSGSITHALGHGAAILASDLPINREIADRVPGALAFFSAGDPNDCSERIAELLADPARRMDLRARARAYAVEHAPARIAGRHVAFYRELAVRGGRT
jgi:glycosyltransferase involved in cell wall biosynthesis